MKYLIALLAVLFASVFSVDTVSAQCANGVCQRPVVSAVRVVLEKQPVRNGVIAAGKTVYFTPYVFRQHYKVVSQTRRSARSVSRPKR